MDAPDEWVPCVSGGLTDLKRLLEACQEEGIAARLAAADACDARGGCGCGPKIQLLTPRDEAVRVAALLARQWHEALAREGTAVALPAAAGNEPPCPACGSTEALEAGACPGCGLQLA